MTKAAIIYARFSTTEQSKGYSLERQKSTAVEFAANRDWVVESIITDEGRSAFHAKNRAQGSALYEFELEARSGLHSGKVLVVENIDRLSRQGAKAAAQLIWSLNEAGVDVATYHDGYIYQAGNNGDMMELFSVIIKAQLAFEESDKKSKRTKASWDSRFNAIENGELDPAKVPHTPNWINRVDGQYVLDAGRTKLLNEIFDLYVAGVGIHRIVTILNDRAEPSWTSIYHKRNVNGWFYSYIYRLLTRRAVLGEFVTSDGRVLATDFYPQAVSADKFNQAQAVLAMKKGNNKRTGKAVNRNLLAQIVSCSECGGGANFNHTTDAVQRYTKVSGEVVNYRRKTYRKLRCDRARRKHNCDNPTILNYDVIEKTVLDELLPRLVNRPAETGTGANLRERIAETNRLIEANQTRLDNLVDALADGGSNVVMKRITALENEIEGQTAQLTELKRQHDIEAAKPANDDDVSLVNSLRDELNSEDDDVRIYARGRVNIALRRLLHRIDILPNDTFRIWQTEQAWWLFDDEGVLLEGEQTL